MAWTQKSVSKVDVLAAVESLERSVTSPSTPLTEIDRAAQKAGSLFLGPLDAPWPRTATHQPGTLAAAYEARPHSALRQLVLEPDPMLGNLPWPSVEVASGPIGLHFNLAESPSLLLDAAGPVGFNSLRPSQLHRPTAKSLIVGASVAANESQVLPEVMEEAKAVAAFSEQLMSTTVKRKKNNSQTTCRKKNVSFRSVAVFLLAKLLRSLLRGR